jgi:hypothetical protein
MPRQAEGGLPDWPSRLVPLPDEAGLTSIKLDSPLRVAVMGSSWAVRRAALWVPLLPVPAKGPRLRVIGTTLNNRPQHAQILAMQKVEGSSPFSRFKKAPPMRGVSVVKGRG